jgi:hypothetical protein
MRVIEHSFQRLRLQRNYQGAILQSRALLLLPLVCLIGFLALSYWHKTTLACTSAAAAAISCQVSHVLLFGGILSALLYPVLLVDLMAVCSFDRATDRFILQRRTLLKRDCIERSLTDVSSVQLHRQPDRGSRASYEVRVVLRSGESFPLPLPHWQARQYYAELTQRIRHFLHFNEQPG